jgi:hypothetical protein
MKKNKKVNESNDVLYNTDFFAHLPGIVVKQGKDKRGNVTLLGGTFELCGRVRGQGEFTTFAIAASYLGLVASKAMKQEGSSFPYELVQEMENFLMELKLRSRRNHERLRDHASALLGYDSGGSVADNRKLHAEKHGAIDRLKCVAFDMKGESKGTFEKKLRNTLSTFLKR